MRYSVSFQSVVRASMCAAVVFAGALANSTQAQELEVLSMEGCTQIIIPQSRAIPLRHGYTGVVIDGVQARVEIREQAASTTMQIELRNDSRSRQEAVLLLPVPDDAAVSGFLFEGASSEPTATILPKDEARRLYDQIVAKVRDPALLEFAGYNLIRTSVFPIEAGGTQRVRLSYDQVLATDGDRVDFVLPRSESLDRRAPWSISVAIQSKRPISTVYSPSHDLVTERLDSGRMNVRLAETARTAPGAFRLSWLLERDGVSASIFAYPDPTEGGGYFLFMAGLPADIGSAARVKRELTVVIDRSGSMAGEKMDQARAAALQVVEGLADGEAFNIIDYSTTVSAFAQHPVIKNAETTAKARAYIATIRPGGGTNIHDALVEALVQKPTEGTLPIVLFLTDGLPTVGKTSEKAIRELAEKGNAHKRRIFAFGVGNDVNVPLLDRIADITRATATYVQPQEDVEVKVAQVFRRLFGPVFSDPTLASTGELKGVSELLPANLPDVYEGDQLVVLGKYRSTSDLHHLKLVLEGAYLGAPKTYEFQFDLSTATTRNAFVPRLWASRRIAYLVDVIRQAGADQMPTNTQVSIFNDPRYRELSDEILKLSTQWGILTEYTSFLATEGTNLGNWGELAASCSVNLDNRAVQSRAGAAAVNQGQNFNEQKLQAKLNYDNRYWNAQMEEVAFSNVQQINDRAFFQRGQAWIDSRLVSAEGGAIQPDVVVEYGSPEHLKILEQLVMENRQGVLSLDGDIMLQLGERNVLIRNAQPPPTTDSTEPGR